MGKHEVILDWEWALIMALGERKKISYISYPFSPLINFDLLKPHILSRDRQMNGQTDKLILV